MKAHLVTDVDTLRQEFVRSCPDCLRPKPLVSAMFQHVEAITLSSLDKERIARLRIPYPQIALMPHQIRL